MKIKELTAKDIKNIMMDKALIIVLVFMIIGIIIIEPSFLQIRVLTDILTQSAVKMICALGLMFALLLGGTDLSGGRQPLWWHPCPRWRTIPTSSGLACLNFPLSFPSS